MTQIDHANMSGKNQRRGNPVYPADRGIYSPHKIIKKKNTGEFRFICAEMKDGMKVLLPLWSENMNVIREYECDGKSLCKWNLLRFDKDTVGWANLFVFVLMGQVCIFACQ